MGLTGCYEDLADLVRVHNPDMVVLTETKLTQKGERKASYIRHVLRNHLLFLGSTGASNRMGERQGAAGVILAIRRDKVIDKVHDIPSHLRQYVKMVDIALTRQAASLTLVGVYAPSGDANTRTQIYQFIDQQAGHKNTIMVGDWNAVTHPQDRTGHTQLGEDKQHQRWIQAGHFQMSRNRTHTHHYAQGTGSSRIDDVLVTTDVTIDGTKVLPHGGNSDHYPLLGVVTPELPIATTRKSRLTRDAVTYVNAPETKDLPAVKQLACSIVHAHSDRLRQMQAMWDDDQGSTQHKIEKHYTTLADILECTTKAISGLTGTKKLHPPGKTGPKRSGGRRGTDRSADQDSREKSRNEASSKRVDEGRAGKKPCQTTGPLL